MHYPTEKWFPIDDEAIPPMEMMDEFLWEYFDPNGEITPELLVDLQSGNYDRGIVTLPYVRQSDNETVYIPQSIIGNLFVSNGMSAGNTKNEARVQGLSEVFERFVKTVLLLRQSACRKFRKV